MEIKIVIQKARKLAEPFGVTNGDKFRLKHVDPGDTLGLKASLFSRTIFGRNIPT